MTRLRSAEILLHPIFVVSLAALLFNDHWLKVHHPSWLTGKLSDAAGLVVFPLLVLVALDALTPLPRRWSTLGLVLAITATLFAIVKCIPTCTALYRVALGALQTPFRGAFAPVHAVTDPTDLVTVPFSAAVLVVGRRWVASSQEGGPSAR
jgi:hypothetical protein